MELYIVVLRGLHVVGGVFWAGVAMLFALYLLPVARNLGPQSAPFMQGLMAANRLPLALSLTSLVTALSGLLLFWRLAGSAFLPFLGTRFGLALSLGALAGLAAILVGFLVNKPTAESLRRLGQEIASAGMPPSAEQAATMNALQQKLRMAANTNGVLLAFSALMMGIARYA